MEERKNEILDSLESILFRLDNGSILYSEERSSLVKELLGTWEKVFQHGLKASSSMINGSLFFQNNDTLNEELSWWPFIQEVLSKDEAERISKSLKSVNTEMGWSRSWLRIAVNEKSLRRTLQCIEKQSLENHYEPWALLRNSRAMDKVRQLSELMESRLKFALLVDHPDLNQSSKQNEMEDFILARVAAETPKGRLSHKKSKKRRNQIVCLDEPPKESLPDPSASSVPPVTSSPQTNRLREESALQESPEDQVHSSSHPPLLYSPKLTPIKNVEIGTLTPIKYDTLHSSSECNSSGNEDDDTEYHEMDSRSSEKEELKSHLLSVLDSKEELQNQLSSLKLLLESENRKVTSLKNELDILKRTCRERDEKKDVRIGILTRENELLKHQLKKYVGAVQRLQDGPRAFEVLSKLEKDPSIDLTKQSHYIDYHFEASEYEKKLVQVAEMHGELLEFNESLQKALNHKDTLLRRYKEELVLLRGPIDMESTENNSDEQLDRLSVDSVASSRPLISIWIPSVFLSGTSTCNPSSSKHHVYQVYLRIRDEEWNVYRRYSEFHALNKQLKKQESTVGSFDFPPKKSLGYRTDKVVEDRKARLQAYLRKVINLMVKKNSSLAENPSKSTLTRLLPFFEEHRVSREFDPEIENTSPSIFSRHRSQSEGNPVPQLAL